ncbi:MAG: hypothetical protein ABIL09_05825 [Gemmatimonadota bacterium]
MNHRPLRIAALIAMALAAASCTQSDEITIRLYPALLVTDPALPPPEGWERIEYAGGPRGGEARFDVPAKPLITEWNITAYKGASQPDCTRVVVARLNAYGEKRMTEFTSDPENSRKHLALRIDQHWADVSPVLSPVRDRVPLYGFTQEEVERLERYLAKR